MSWADNSVNHSRNLHISNPRSMHVPSLVKIPWHYSSYRPEMKWECLGQITPWKWDEICPLAIQKQTSTNQCTYQVWWKSIDVHLSYREMKIWTCLRQITPSKFDEIWSSAFQKPDLHNINAQTKSGENPLKFTQVIIPKRNTDGWMDGWTTDRRETIIPCHYCK